MSSSHKLPARAGHLWLPLSVPFVALLVPMLLLLLFAAYYSATAMFVT
jgi:hypothetical protein